MDIRREKSSFTRSLDSDFLASGTRGYDKQGGNPGRENDGAPMTRTLTEVNTKSRIMASAIKRRRNQMDHAASLRSRDKSATSAQNGSAASAVKQGIDRIHAPKVVQEDANLVLGDLEQLLLKDQLDGTIL